MRMAMTSHLKLQSRSLGACRLCRIEHQCRMTSNSISQGESGLCSDVTSTHGAWRHAGVRFLLSGEVRQGQAARPPGIEPRPACLQDRRLPTELRLCLGAPAALAKFGQGQQAPTGD